ncbi:hypothetical protein MMC28_003067 [Mycoblastus sanguinarius]|nr:hypothetical protein [Mycoblastus sanguinarius]
MANQDPAQPSPSSTTPSPSHALTSPRSRKQLSIFLAGASFFTLSALITRRSLHRRYAATIPRFYHPSNRPPSTPINGPLEALAALHLATLNVCSFMMMMGGGLLWAFDVSSIEDMRRKVKGGLGVDGGGTDGRDEEEALEELVASILARKEGKEKRRKRRGGEEDVEERVTDERGKER